MTNKESISYLTKAAKIKEEAIRLREETGNLFCFGVYAQREIHINPRKWDELVAALQPNPAPEKKTQQDDKLGTWVEFFFYTMLCGQIYKIYTFGLEEEKQ